MMKKLICICMSTIMLLMSACAPKEKPAADVVATDGTTVAADQIFILDGVSVPLHEYRLHLLLQRLNYESSGYGEAIWNYSYDDGTTVYDMALESALSVLVDTKILNSKAAEFGVSVTDEEKAEVVEQSQLFIDNIAGIYGPELFAELGITIEQVETVVLESLIANKMFEAITADYVPDENEFAAEYTRYLSEGKIDYMTANVNFIQVEDQATADEVQARLDAGENFFALAAEYSSDPYATDGTATDNTAAATTDETAADETVTDETATDETEETESPAATPADNASATIVTLNMLGVAEEIMIAAFEMEIGEVSAFVENYAGFVCFKLASIDEPDYAELEALFRENFIYVKEGQIFTEQCEAWSAAADLILNEQAFADTIIPGLPRPELNFEDLASEMGITVDEDAAE